MAARTTSGNPVAAEKLLLLAIAAVLVGRAAIAGGTGSVGRLAIGILIVIVMRIGVTCVGVGVFVQQILFGSVLICATRSRRTGFYCAS